MLEADPCKIDLTLCDRTAQCDPATELDRLEDRNRIGGAVAIAHMCHRIGRTALAKINGKRWILRPTGSDCGHTGRTDLISVEAPLGVVGNYIRRQRIERNRTALGGIGCKSMWCHTQTRQRDE